MISDGSGLHGQRMHTFVQIMYTRFGGRSCIEMGQGLGLDDFVEEKGKMQMIYTKDCINFRRQIFADLKYTNAKLRKNIHFRYIRT